MTDLNETLTRVIRHTVFRARERGLESHEQSKEAVNAVRNVRPDMSAIDVQRLVEQVMVG